MSNWNKKHQAQADYLTVSSKSFLFFIIAIERIFFQGATVLHDEDEDNMCSCTCTRRDALFTLLGILFSLVIFVVYVEGFNAL
jgi:hypothetical protein